MRLFTLPRTIAALLAVGVSLPIAALAQPQDAQSQQTGSQDSSVAEAARRSREKKRTRRIRPSPRKSLPTTISISEIFRLEMKD